MKKLIAILLLAGTAQAASYDFPAVDTTTCLDIYRECGGEAYRICILMKGGYHD